MQIIEKENSEKGENVKKKKRQNEFSTQKDPIDALFALALEPKKERIEKSYKYLSKSEYLFSQYYKANTLFWCMQSKEVLICIREQLW